MSRNSYNQFHRDWKFFLQRCKESGLKIFGVPAPSYVLEAYALWITIWFDTFVRTWSDLSQFSLPYLDTHYKIPKDRCRFRVLGRRLPMSHDVGDTVSAAKRADEMLVHYWTDPDLCSRPSVESLAQGNEVLSTLLGWVYPCVSVATSGGKPLWCHRHLRTCLLFLSRLNFVTPEQEKGILDEWVLIQDELKRTKFDPQILDVAERIAYRVTDGIEFSNSIGKHGPGAVAESPFKGRKARFLSEKYYFSEWTPKLRYLARDVPGIRHPFGKDVCHQRPSELRFVPKQMGRYRSICMEPPANQFVLEGLKDTLVRWFEDSFHLKRHIRLKDDAYNREHAAFGSFTRSLATIDLSHASDSVSVQLFRKLFRHTALFKPFLLGRTGSTVLPSGEEYEIGCFATMGSALCFPVECLIFLVACETAITMEGEIPACHTFWVYGDDIVIETRFVRRLVGILTNWGFEVNVSKSFFTDGLHCFRESCGGHYLDGVDVTPTYIPRRFQGLRSMLPLKTSGLIDLANRLFLDWPHARDAVVRAIITPLRVKGKKGRVSYITRIPRFVPFDRTSDWSNNPEVRDSLALYSWAPTNWRSRDKLRTAVILGRERYTSVSQLSKDLQRTYYQAWVPQGRLLPVSCEDKGEAALYEWYLRGQVGNDLDPWVDEEFLLDEQPTIIHAQAKVCGKDGARVFPGTDVGK